MSQLKQQNQILPRRLVTEGGLDHHPLTIKQKLDTATPNIRSTPSRLVGDRNHNPPITQEINCENSYTKSKIYIAALNVLTLKNDESLTELVYALKQIKWDIVGLSEVRRMGERIISHPDFLLYHIGTTPGQYGVGFIIKKYLTNYVESFIGVSERIALMNLKLPGYKDPWTIIQVYSPTEQSDTVSIESFYLDLNKTIQDYAYKNLVVIGDFNGQIGERQPEEDTVLGPFVYGKKARSRNGERLVNFAQENGLRILNTVFKKKESKMWTWSSPDGKTKNQIDFIMSNKSRYFSNMKVISNFNFNTNHRIIRAELTTTPPKNSRPRNNMMNTKPTKYQISQIANSVMTKLIDYKKETTNMEVQEKYDWLEGAIKAAIQQGTNNKDLSNKWMTTKTINLLKQRANLIKEKNSNDNRKQIAKLSKEIKESIRKDRTQKRMETIERHILQTGGIKKAHKELSNKKDWIVQMKDSNSLKENRRQGILGIARSYYKKLYENNIEEKEIELLEFSSVPSIIQDEIEFAIETQRDNKAPGPDRISNEVLKQAKQTITPILKEIFNDIINTETIPQQWTKSNIILLYKKGDQYDIGNYRPISLMSNLYKIFAKILLKRMEGKLDEQQPIEQAGFRRNYSVLDHIHAVRQIIEKYTEYQLIYYLAFVDYTKAFDSLIHANIWEALREQGIEQKYIRLIRNVYKNSSACIQLEKKGDSFKIQKGVRQGDPLSPKLFSSVLEMIFRSLDWENLGLNIDGRTLTHLRFADDIVLFAKTPGDLNRMLNELASESEKVGLKLNPEKTKVMTNGTKSSINVGKSEITYVEEYIYLGQLISPKDNINKEIKRRIANSWKRYWDLREIMKDKNLHIGTKGKLFNVCILPILMYGSQTWALTKNITNRIAICQRAMERSMIGVKRKDKIRNTNIRKNTKTQDVTLKIKRLKWKWAGHMVRGKEKWSKITTHWYPREGKRKRGRQQKRWDDDIRQVAGITWSRVARERSEWSRLEEAFANWQTDLQRVNKHQIHQF